jgi:hypothetical protein
MQQFEVAERLLQPLPDSVRNVLAKVRGSCVLWLQSGCTYFGGRKGGWHEAVVANMCCG